MYRSACRFSRKAKTDREGRWQPGVERSRLSNVAVSVGGGAVMTMTGREGE